MGPVTIATAKGLFVARKSPLVGILASLVAAAFALIAFSGHPGAAAVVDGQKIPERDISTAVSQWQPVVQQQLTPATMLSTVIRAPIVLEVAADHGISASEEDGAAYLDSLAEQSQIEPPETYADITIEVARMQMVLGTLNSGQVNTDGIAEELTERTNALDVTVNPRYGEWDAQAASGGFIAPVTPDWLIAPAADAPAVG